jgi:hypothetical protein
MRLRRKDGTFTSRGVALRNWRHGEAVGNKLSPEYTAFRAAQKRCRWKGDSNFANYGGRGIKFLFHSFTQFLKEIGRKPSPKHVLDRIDNNGHYQSGNVRWATRSQSVKNRRTTKKLQRSWQRNIRKAQKAQSREQRQVLGRRTAARLKRNPAGMFTSSKIT